MSYRQLNDPNLAKHVIKWWTCHTLFWHSCKEPMIQLRSSHISWSCHWVLLILWLASPPFPAWDQRRVFPGVVVSLSVFVRLGWVEQLDVEAKATKRHLLTNAWARCICMVLLALRLSLIGIALEARNSSNGTGYSSSEVDLRFVGFVVNVNHAVMLGLPGNTLPCAETAEENFACHCLSPSLRLPFHLDTILIPFACINMGDGIFVLADVPSVQCATTDETFVTMFGAGRVVFVRLENHKFTKPICFQGMNGTPLNTLP